MTNLHTQHLNRGFLTSTSFGIEISEFKAGDVNVETKTGQEFKAVSPITGRKVEKGQLVATYHNAHNQGFSIYEIMGITGHEVPYGEAGPKYNSVKETLEAYGVKSLKALEAHCDENYAYGHAPHIYVRDIETGEAGPWLYLYNGRWACNSGAEHTSFILVEEVK